MDYPFLRASVSVNIGGMERPSLTTAMSLLCELVTISTPMVMRRTHSMSTLHESTMTMPLISTPTSTGMVVTGSQNAFETSERRKVSSGQSNRAR